MYLLFIVYGLFFFTRGFLLSRNVLPDVSSCSEPPLDPSIYTSENTTTGHTSSSCWIPESPPKYKRAILLLVDALRFDFTLHDPSLPEPLPPYLNRLPIFSHLLETKPRQSLLYQFLADPPTTTLQRLKALSTGTLPTFIDAGSNFAGSAILEDSWVNQCALSNRSISFVGDDTWLSVFPTSFRSSFPYPSLNVWDLHTVDEGVLKHLPTLMDDPTDTIILGHFLGVDHCGHRYGPSHPAMSAKLTQMDKILSDILRNIDEDTVVFIFGDHGMDGKGDHGGDSKQEVEAGLFVFSGRELPERGGDFDHLLRTTEDAIREHGGDDAVATWSTHASPSPSRSHGTTYRSVSQVDLVPTISLALGLPIPFGSLGAVIPEVFWSDDRHETTWSGSSPRHPPPPSITSSIRVNAHQISRYVHTYASRQSSVGDFPPATLDLLDDLLAEAESFYFDADYTAAYTAYMVYARKALGICREAWAKFDVPAMMLGWIIMGLAILGLALDPSSSHFPRNRSLLLSGLAPGLALAIVERATSTLLPLPEAWTHLGWVDKCVIPMAFSLLLTLLGRSVMGRVRLIVKGGPSDDKVDPVGATSTQNNVPHVSPNGIRRFIGGLLLSLHLVVFVSNSYLVQEGGVVAALLLTQGIVDLLLALASSSSSLTTLLPSLAHLLFIRLVSSVKECREEQLPGCVPTLYASPGGTNAGFVRLSLMILFAVIIAPVCLSRLWRWASEASPSSGKGLTGRYSAMTLSLSMALLSLYWAIEEAGAERGWLEVWKVWGARGAMVSATVGMTIASYIDQSKGASSKANSFALPTTLGAIGCAVAITAVPLQPTAIMVMAAALPHLLALTRMWMIQDKEALTPSTAPFHRIVTLALLSQLYFFGTGHQATLPSIQWRSAFFGLRDVNWVLSPLLVFLNTFGAFLLWPFLISFALPAISRPSARTSSRMHVLWILYWATIAWSVAGSSMIFRRHLMVWKVWTPRFLLAAICVISSLVSALVLRIYPRRR